MYSNPGDNVGKSTVAELVLELSALADQLESQSCVIDSKLFGPEGNTALRKGVDSSTMGLIDTLRFVKEVLYDANIRFSRCIEFL